MVNAENKEDEEEEEKKSGIACLPHAIKRTKNG